MIQIIQYNNNVIESPFIATNYAFISHASVRIPIEYKFISIHSRIYTVTRTDKITDDYIHVYGSIINVKPLQTIVAFNIKNVSSQVCIDIIDSKSREIEMQLFKNEIYSIIGQLCLLDKQIVETLGYKFLVSAPNQTSYFVVDKSTTINVIHTASKYKLYDAIQKMAHKVTIYCDIKLSNVATAKRLNSYEMCNVDEIKKNAMFKLNPAYIGKQIVAESNKTAFEMTITGMSCDIPSDKTICFLSDYVFSFITSDPNIIICSTATMQGPTQFDIELLEITKKYNADMNESDSATVYKMNDITKNILKLFANSCVIKVDDTYEMFVDNTLLQFRIKSIHTKSSNSAKFCFYNPPLNISFCIFSNFQKQIYVMEEPIVSNIQTMDIQLTLKKCNPNNESVHFDEDLLKCQIKKIKSIMSYNIGKTIQLTIADFQIDAIIVNLSAEVDYSSRPVLLCMNNQTQIHLLVDPADTTLLLHDKSNKSVDKEEKKNACLGLTRSDLRNIKMKLESYGMSGMDDQIKILTKELFLPRTNFMPKGLLTILRPTRGVILYGPPGTGKTTLARNIGKLLHISESNVSMITATEVLNKYIGESEENIRNIFKPSRDAPEDIHLLIIDEIDAILGSRQNQPELRNSIVNQFLGEMDGLNQISNILVIGITNRLDMLDSAVLRPGRFSCLIKCDLPNNPSRKQILQLYINKLQTANIFTSDIDLDIIVEKTNGFSGAEIEYIFNCLIDNLAQYVFDEETAESGDYHITHKQVLDVIAQIKNRKT